MDEGDVRALLGRVGLEPQVVTEIPGGWANRTYDLDGVHIVRVPRTDAVALATHRELRLLPRLAEALPFAVPAPTHVGTWRDRPFFAYRRIPGRPLTAADRTDPQVATVLGSMLAELHAFPVDEAAHLLHLGHPHRVWRDRYEDLWPTIEEVVLPELDGDLAVDVARAFHRLVADPPGFPVTLVHDDLGPAHVLLDERGVPHALIDFEDASVGDPAIDLVGVLPVLGADALPALLAGRDLGDRLGERLHFYRWMGSVHAVLYGVTQGVEEERIGGIGELRKRLDEPVAVV